MNCIWDTSGEIERTFRLLFSAKKLNFNELYGQDLHVTGGEKNIHPKWNILSDKTDIFIVNVLHNSFFSENFTCLMKTGLFVPAKNW